MPVQGCPPFLHLTLTGGAIGSGPPMALGAAVALAAAEEAGIGDGTRTGGRGAAANPSYGRRRVINLQADGSAMYTLQVRRALVRFRLTSHSYR